jgi:ABC-type lipoprotein export system ATPase subunit
VLTARGLGYRLPDGRELFRDLDLHVGPGEAVAIEGPSGTGKSTLLALLGGLLEPTSGTVETADSGNRPFGWVLQSLNSLSARTVMDNAMLYSRLDNRPTRDSRAAAEAALAELGLAGLAHTRVRKLSGGELQRLAVARVVACNRPIVLADEPSNQLDQANARLVMSTLVSSANESRCVVVVTHDRASLPAGCTVLRLAQDGLHVAS